MTDALARFWAKVDQRGDCWLWKAGAFRRGYGMFYIAGRTVQAHRFIHESLFGPIPEGQCVLHRCDTPRCVRPSHLFLGTQATNRADCVAKSRQAKGQTHNSVTRPETVPRGEQHGRSKVTAAEVASIRARASTGERVAVLAREYGLSWWGVKKIVLHQNWKHINAA